MALPTFKVFLETASSLDKVALNMFFRTEFDANALQANELVEWFILFKDWEDLDHDARGCILDRWDPAVIQLPSGKSYDDFTMDEIATIMKQKYKLDSWDYI